MTTVVFILVYAVCVIVAVVIFFHRHVEPGVFRRLRCYWTRPVGHDWQPAGRKVLPRGAFSTYHAGPLRVCPNCGAEDWGNPEQSVGG